jgi:hypothetical protein
MTSRRASSSFEHHTHHNGAASTNAHHRDEYLERQFFEAHLTDTRRKVKYAYR